MQKATFAFIFTIVLLAILLVYTPTSAQTPQPTTAPVSTATVEATTSPQTTTPAQIDPEVIALRAQLEQMQRTDDQLLNTIYWALGGIFTLTAGIIFYNGFATNRNYERDKAFMQTELLSLLRNETNHLDRKIQDQINSSIQRTQEELRSDHRVMKAEVDQHINQMNTALMEAINQSTTQIKSQIVSINYKVAELRFDMLMSEAEEAEGTKSYGDALFLCSLMLEIAPHLVLNVVKTEDTLTLIQRLLLVAEDLDADIVAPITKQLDKLPPEYTTVKARIHQLFLQDKKK